MLHLTILAVGKIKEEYLRKGISEYKKRLTPYVKLKIVEVADSPLDKTLLKAKEEEGNRILKALKEKTFVAVLDPGGRMITSEEFSGWLGEREMGGKEVFIVIGGASGLVPEVLARADDVLSFSNLTFPHQLFRLILVEQIYRGFKILRGEKYHL
jgi:23S rRNA (pseudouridine1915-N3)-methyltransferase